MKNHPNYNFYNNGTWDEVKQNIRDIIKCYHNDPKTMDLQKLYCYFEYDHSFIQWLFPNLYPSRFNLNSFKLTLEERELMIKSQDVLKRFYKNYKLILLFFGIEIKFVDLDDDLTQSEEQSEQGSASQNSKQKRISTKLKRKPTQIHNQTSIMQYLHQKIKPFQIQTIIQENQIIDDTSQLLLRDKQQFEKCCFKNTHNLLRLKRILGSLSVLKHRREAIQLVNFLKTQFKILGKEKVYHEYFSGFEEYYEELPTNQQKKITQGRYFNGYKELYVEQSLIEKVDISIIN